MNAQHVSGLDYRELDLVIRCQIQPGPRDERAKMAINSDSRQSDQCFDVIHSFGADTSYAEEHIRIAIIFQPAPQTFLGLQPLSYAEIGQFQNPPWLLGMLPTNGLTQIKAIRHPAKG